ncbi:MAG: hypothetical protein ACRERX_20055 [Pseudomonas sp.]
MRIVTVVILHAAALHTAWAQAPAVVEVRGTTGCKGCSIELRRVARLGNASDPILVVQGPRIARDSRGFFYLAPTSEPGTLAIYDAGGRFVRSMGKAGLGPNEFQSIRNLMIGPADTLFVFEGGAARMTRLSPGGKIISRARIPGVPNLGGVALLRDGRVALALTLRTRQRIGLPIHVIERTGAVIMSFGADPATVVLPGESDSRLRSIAIGNGNSIWSAPVNRYEIERWTPNGLQRQTVRRIVDWFQPWKTRRAGRPDEVRPSPRLLGVTEDPSGRLWTLVQTAAGDWKQTGQPPADARMESNRPVLSHDARQRYFETVIEVIDSSTGRLLASRRLPGIIAGFYQGNLITRVNEDADGFLYTDVWELRFIARQ